jgi:gas vesicle protein
MADSNGDHFKYRVIQLQPETKRVFLSKEERKNTKGLNKGLAVLLCLVVGFTCYHLGVPISKLLNLELPYELWAFTFSGVLTFLVIGVVVAGVISYLIKTAKIRNSERKKTNEANRQEVERVGREAKNLTADLNRTYEASIEGARQLSKCLDEASAWLRTAQAEYQATAFSRFWDAVEQAAIWLKDYQRNADEIAKNANTYYRDLNGRKHTFPKFPVSLQSLPPSSTVVSELRRLMRLGETNFQFASILESRKTRKAIVAGFRSLHDAIDDLGYKIEDTVSELRDSMSSNLAQVVEEQIRTRETVDGTPEVIEKTRLTVEERASKIDDRLREQTRILDNIQHDRAR